MPENRECSSASSCSKESCEGCSHSADAKPDFTAEMNPYSSVKKVIGVVSGKGGVGKSFVTASLAAQMRKKGFEVGILDADITGPSIPKMFGVHGPAVGNDLGMYPIEAADGTKIMSINLLMDDEEAPVVWRGPVIAGTVKQFWSDVVWGDLDYLFVDMPPGTGDVPLTVFQSLPVDGIVIVTSPQELVQMIVKKAYNMASMMDIPVLGHKNGTELSGGEGQKLMLARALYKDAPLLILDEPTAALDPIAESRIYAEFHAMTENKTSLFISHRLASTSFCDRIILLENGRIAEEGTHRELIAANGKYKELFDIQSCWYKEDMEGGHGE